MKNLLFATTNEGKLKEAKSILKMNVVGISLDINEIQSLNSVKVATEKALSYYRNIKKPIFVEDVSVFIDAIKGLPGPYIDDFWNALGNEGIISLVKHHRNRSILAQSTIVFVDKKGDTHIFTGSVKGTIPDNPRGVGFGWDPIFVPEGNKKTFGELTMEEKNCYSMRAIALNKFKKWLLENQV